MLEPLSRATTVAPTAVAPPPRRWWSRVGLPAFLVLAFALLFLRTAWHNLRPRVQVQTSPVVVRSAAELGVVARGAEEIVASAPGWVEAAPYPIAVPALANGVVEQILVLDGDSVQAGQVVARLIADDARIARDEAAAVLARERAELGLARARLANARLAWEHPVAVERNVAVSRASLAHAEAALARLPSEEAESRARLAELRVEFQQLQRTGVWSPSFTVEAAGYRVSAESARLAGIVAREPMLAAEVERLYAELDAAEQLEALRFEERLALDVARALVSLESAKVAGAAARLADAELRLSRMEVQSPAAGIVLRRMKMPGDKAFADMDDPHSAHIVHLYDPDTLQVRTDVPLADAAQLGLGQRVEIICELLPDRVFTGRVLRIVQLADLVKNTVEAQVSVTGAGGLLTPDMLVRVKFFARPGEVDAAEEPSGMLVLAREELLVEGPSAWVLDPDAGVARRRALRLGRKREGGAVEVLDGLFPGEQLIDARRLQLEEGIPVAVVGEVRDNTVPTGRGGRF